MDSSVVTNHTSLTQPTSAPLINQNALLSKGLRFQLDESTRLPSKRTI